MLDCITTRQQLFNSFLKTKEHIDQFHSHCHTQNGTLIVKIEGAQAFVCLDTSKHVSAYSTSLSEMW
jgi:hypothetical protein